MKHSEEISEIAKALCHAQAAMKPASKDSLNPHFKSRFSDLAAVWESIREPLTSNGLVILQDALTTDSGISITTKIVHTSGQWFEFGPLDMPSLRKDCQAYGSAITYGKRYALCAAIGIVSDDDDDGESTYDNRGKKPKERPLKPQVVLPVINENDLQSFIEENKLKDPGNPLCMYLVSMARKREMPLSEMYEYCYRNREGFFKAFKAYQESLETKKISEQNYEE